MKCVQRENHGSFCFYQDWFSLESVTSFIKLLYYVIRLSSDASQCPAGITLILITVRNIRMKQNSLSQDWCRLKKTVIKTSKWVFLPNSLQIHVHLHVKCIPSFTIIIPGSGWSMEYRKNMQHASLDIINSSGIIVLTFEYFISLILKI